MKYSDWATLSYAGKNPVSKLVIFAPIVAQILIRELGSNAFIESLNLWWLDWAYWSLISFAIAQIIYILACPSDIKAYPNRHEYIQSLNNTETDDYLRRESFDIIKKNFKGYGGKLDLTRESLEELNRRMSIQLMKESRDGNLHERDYGPEAIEALCKLAKSLDTGKLREIDWSILEKNIHHFAPYLVSQDTQRWQLFIYNFEHNIKTYATNSHWRVKLLNIRYKKQNLSAEKWRYGCVIFYLFGISYFAFSAFVNVVRVMTTYF